MLIRIICRSKWNDQRKWYESQGVKSYFAVFEGVLYGQKRQIQHLMPVNLIIFGQQNKKGEHNEV